jgi:hypothetical protein
MEIEHKLIKVTFQYENETNFLEGEDAERWLKCVDDMCMLAEAHGLNPFATEKFEWKTEEKK